MYPVNRWVATLGRRLVAALPSARTAGRGAATHHALAGLPRYQRLRNSSRSRRLPRPLGATRRPTLASGIRCRSALVRQRCRRCFDASEPESRAGSRL